MRIGIDARLWNETGVGRYTRNLLRELALIDKKNEYVLFVLSKDVTEIQNYDERIKKNIEEGKWKTHIANIRWHTIAEQIAFPKLLQQENLDLVHFPYFSVPLFYNRQFIVTIHDLIVHHFPTGQASTLPYPLYFLKLQGYKYVISQAAKKSCRILAVSEATKAEVVKHLGVPEDKVVVTYEGIDEATQKEKRKEPIIKEDYFLYVGNAYPHKNLKTLIDAFYIVRQTSPNIKLILAGRNDFFYTRLRRGLLDSVVMLSSPSDGDLVNLYRNTKALVVPSLMEGFGLPSLEAMANGCPVLASDIPSFHEICDKAAVYFNPKSVDDLAQKMRQVLLFSKKERDAYISLGKKRVQHFSWAEMAKETLKVYETCSSASTGI